MGIVSKIPRVVIVGAGFAGLNAAKALKKANVKLTVIDKSNHHLFQPLLYQVATASLSPAGIAFPIRSILRRQKNAEVVLSEVQGIDLKKGIVRCDNTSFAFDFLVIATGARHSYFSHPEWERFAPGLKSISDATELRRKILLSFEAAETEEVSLEREKLMRFVLVGGGPTGVEMAGAIAELSHKALASDFRKIDPRSAQIILVEAGPRILSSFSSELSQKAEDSLTKLGVEVRTNSPVHEINEKGVKIGDEFILTSNVIWTAGVRASPAATWLGVEADAVGRVKVNSDLSLPSHPNIFVIGDTAAVLGDSGKYLPGVAPVAMQQGQFVARLIVSHVEGKKCSKRFTYIDRGNLATIGRSSAIAQIGKVQMSGFLAWLSWTFIHIYFLIGFKNRLFVLFEWAWAYFTFQRGARLIVDPGNRERMSRRN